MYFSQSRPPLLLIKILIMKFYLFTCLGFFVLFCFPKFCSRWLINFASGSFTVMSGFAVLSATSRPKHCLLLVLTCLMAFDYDTKEIIFVTWSLRISKWLVWQHATPESGSWCVQLSLVFPTTVMLVTCLVWTGCMIRRMDKWTTNEGHYYQN